MDKANGAKDIANFENQLSFGRIPSPDSIQYEGTYYKFMFETGEELEKLFSPVFYASSSKDPLNAQPEYFLCMGMNSKLDGSGLQKHGGRPNINLSIILDVSGSMNCSFGETREEMNLTKLEVAKTSLITGLLPQLTPKDRLSFATFTEDAQIIQNIAPLGSIDMTALKEKISLLTPGGGTELIAGMRAAANELLSIYPSENESRVFYFTDMDPGTYPQQCDALLNLTAEISKKNIYVTFVGVGLDFNSAVVKRIAEIKGCSYMSVKTSNDFKKMMDEEFRYFVTVAAQDVKVQLRNLETSGWEVEEVFGSPGNEHPSDGVLCKVSSIFPSPKASRTETKGGVVVIKLRPTTPNPEKELIAVTTYLDKDGKEFTDKQVIRLPEKGKSDFFDGTAIRKGVLLTRYVKIVKRVLEDAQNAQQGRLRKDPEMTVGIFSPLPATPQKGEGRPDGKLSESYSVLFDRIENWFAEEAESLNDPLLMDLIKNWEEIRKAALPAATPSQPPPRTDAAVVAPH